MVNARITAGTLFRFFLLLILKIYVCNISDSCPEIYVIPVKLEYHIFLPRFVSGIISIFFGGFCKIGALQKARCILNSTYIRLTL